MKFWNCKKVLVDDLTDYSSTWTGYNAKYFEECTQSNNALISVYEKEYRAAVADELIYGTISPISAKYCTSFFGSSSSALTTTDSVAKDTAMEFSKMAYDMMFNYLEY